jgi:SAM-dependent methyltransferase
VARAGSSTATPNAARIYDALLGGRNSSAADQDAAGELLRVLPDAASAARQNRNFLEHAVRFIATQTGIRQFLDIGIYLSAEPGAHQIAQQARHSARVVYVDHDPAVTSRAQSLLAGNPRVAVIKGDLRHPQGIFGDPAFQGLISLDEPVAVLLGAVLHFVAADAGPRQIVRSIVQAMAPGSYLVLSHFTHDDLSPGDTRRVRQLYQRTTVPVVPRSHREIIRFFDGLELIAPGLVNGSRWRPGHAAADPRRTLFYAGVGRKS